VTKPVRKAFSRSMYDMVDTPAKEALTSILEKRGHTIVATKEDYFADVKSTKNGLDYFSEAEVKLGWKGTWNPDWKEIRIPERKSRLLEKYKETSGVLNFYVFRADMAYVWRIKDSQLTDNCLKTAKGRWIKPGEKFFHIPYKDAELIKV
jgi:hypothetical protein